MGGAKSAIKEVKKKFFSTPTHVGKRKKCIVVISTKEGVTNMTVK